MGELQKNTRFEHLLRLADTNLILGHRMSEWIGKSPILEEELALTNIGLDLIGQARALYEHAVAVSGEEDNRDADDLAPFVEDDAPFGQVERKRIALFTGLAQQRPAESATSGSRRLRSP